MTSTLSTRKALFLESLEKNMGIVSIAAEKVGMERSVHYKWMQSDMKYKTKVEALREKMIDLTESKMYQLINGFEIEEEKLYFDKNNLPQVVKIKKKVLPDAGLIKFQLETIGKGRGYVKTSEVNTNVKIIDPDEPIIFE